VRRDYAFPGHEPSFSILSDKAKYSPWGLFGGGEARPAKYVLNPETAGARELPSKITFQLAAGDVVSVQTPGGGGIAGALERDPERVAADVALGKISPERARSVYGVVVDARTHALDDQGTAAERAAMARRGAGT
jgi:N-methylhydantoinase B